MLSGNNDHQEQLETGEGEVVWKLTNEGTRNSRTESKRRGRRIRDFFGELESIQLTVTDVTGLGDGVGVVQAGVVSTAIMLMSGSKAGMYRGETDNVALLVSSVGVVSRKFLETKGNAPTPSTSLMEGWTFVMLTCKMGADGVFMSNNDGRPE